MDICDLRNVHVGPPPLFLRNNNVEHVNLFRAKLICVYLLLTILQLTMFVTSGSELSEPYNCTIPFTSNSTQQLHVGFGTNFSL